MITQISPIRGLSVGLEYDETEEFGFVINCDLVFVRITWFRDLEMDE